MTHQRVTLITLGVSDLGVSRRFYEALGWQAHRETQDSIVFFQLNTMSWGCLGRWRWQRIKAGQRHSWERGP